MSPCRTKQTATTEQLANVFSLEPLWYALSKDDRKSMRVVSKDVEARSRCHFRRLLVCVDPKYGQEGEIRAQQLATFHDKLTNARAIIFARSKVDRDQYQHVIEEYATCAKQETLARIKMVVFYKVQLDAWDIRFVVRHFPNARFLDIHLSVAAPSVFTAMQSLELERIYLRGTDAIKVPIEDVATSIAGAKVVAFGDIPPTRELLNGLLNGMKNLEVLWFGSTCKIEDMVPDVRHERLQSLKVCKDIVTKMCNPVLVCSSTPSSEIRVTPPGFMRRLMDKLPSLTSICGVALDACDPVFIDLLPRIAHKAHLWAAFVSIDEFNVHHSVRPMCPEIKYLIVQVDAAASPRWIALQLQCIIARFENITHLHIRFTPPTHAATQLSRAMSELANSICTSKLLALYVSLGDGADDSTMRDVLACAAMGAAMFVRKLTIVVPHGAASSVIAKANALLQHMQRPSRLSCWPSI